jgi:hypothetical protein
MSPFDFVNAINMSKKDMIRESENPELAEKSYNPFLVNRAMSYFIDTILYANEMNVNNTVEKQLQNDYLINSIRKGKRFSKWSKTIEEPDVQCVQEYYNISYKRALEACSILTKEHIDLIKQKLIKGGLNVQSKPTGRSST